MSTTITIAITADETGGYTARELAILSAISAHPSQGAAASVPASRPAPAATPKPEPKAAEKPAPKAEKPAPSPKSEQSTTPAVLDTSIDEPVEEAEAADEDLVGGEEKHYTLQDAVARATKLVSQKQQAKVKAGLEAAGGAKKVSDLKTQEAIDTFMAEVGEE